MSVRGPQTGRDWEEVFGVVEEYGIAKLEAGGITDDAMRGLAELDCVTHLNVSGSKGLTDDGAQLLAACDRLESVNVMGSAAGDGLIRALAGKDALRFLDTGRRLTDAGIYCTVCSSAVP